MSEPVEMLEFDGAAVSGSAIEWATHLAARLLMGFATAEEWEIALRFGRARLVGYQAERAEKMRAELDAVERGMLA